MTQRLPESSRFLLLDAKDNLSLFRKTSEEIWGIVQPWAPLTPKQDKELIDFAHSVMTPETLCAQIDLRGWSINREDTTEMLSNIEYKSIHTAMPEPVRIIKEGLIQKYTEAVGKAPYGIGMDINMTEDDEPHLHPERNAMTYAHRGASTTGYDGERAFQFPARALVIFKEFFWHKSPTPEIAKCSPESLRISFAVLGP